MRIFLAILFFTSLSFSQISNDQINVNVLGGSLTLSGTSAVTQSGSWTVGRTWTTASSTDSTSAVVTSMPAITGSVSITGTPTIANTAFGISGSLPAGSNALGSITNTIFGSTQSGVWNVGLSTGSNVIGSISNTGFGITGTLPAFASTPTFNIGTGAFVDRTTAAAPYAQRLSDGSAFYDARSIRSLVFATDKVDTSGSSVSVSNFPATQAISAAALPLPTGAATETTLSAINTNSTNGTQKTKIVDAANNTIASIDDGNGTKALEIAQGATSFVFSSVNSSTTQLAAAATFAGAVESVTNQQSASILLTTDQNGTLVLREYIDAAGLRQSRVSTYTIVANVPFSRSFVLNGNYFRAAFTNNGGATTTTFNLNTAYGTIPSATALGNGQVSLDEINGTAFVGATKGVQPALALPTQNLIDSGRVKKIFSATFTAATTEALVTLTPITDGVAGTTGTSFSVTAGKRFRLQSACITTRNAGAAAQGVVIQVRQTSTGAITTTSPLIGTVAAGTGIAVANVSAANCYTFADGIEFSGTEQFGVSQVGSATANNTVVLTGFEY